MERGHETCVGAPLQLILWLFFVHIHYHRLDRTMHANVITLHKHRVLDCDIIWINNRLVSSYEVISIREAFEDEAWHA